MVVSSTHKTVLILVVVVVLGIVGWFGYSKWYLPRYTGPQSHEASGHLKSMTSDQLVMSGVHIIDGQKLTTGASSHSEDLTVVLTPDTKLVKSVWRVPVTLKALTDGKTKLDPATIQKTPASGSMSDFQNVTGFPMTVRTADNSANESTLQASEIDYTTYIFAQ